MDSLVNWEFGGGSDELLTALGRMTLLFTAVDECITAAIYGYIGDRPPLKLVLGDTPLAKVSAEHFTRKRDWLKSILDQMDDSIDGHSDIRQLVGEVGSLNADRIAYTHGLVRLTEKTLTFQNRGRELPAPAIDALNDRLTAWMGKFLGAYINHCEFIKLNAETEQS